MLNIELVKKLYKNSATDLIPFQIFSIFSRFLGSDNHLRIPLATRVLNKNPAS